MLRTLKIGFSYLRVALFPARQVDNLEQFFISRFGRELYNTFFRSYTEKVWGVPCTEISAEWGAQRVKGLSITKTILHVLKKTFAPSGDVRQKGTETSLIEQFLYPKLGPGSCGKSLPAKSLRKAGKSSTVSTSTKFWSRGIAPAASVGLPRMGSAATSGASTCSRPWRSKTW